MALGILVAGLTTSRAFPLHRAIDAVSTLLDRGGIAYASFVSAGVAFAVLCGVVLLRYLLLTLFNPRR
jgi:hypothetical protein